MSTLYSPREPLLDKTSFEWNVDYTNEKRLPALEHDLSDATLDRADQIEANWRLGRERLQYAIMLFSGGQSLDEVAAQVRSAVDGYEAFAGYYADEADTPQIDFAIQTYYVDALWLVSLVRLLGLGSEQVERVANVYAADPTNDGADELFELLLAKLDRKSFEAEGVVHEDPYQLLLDCVKAEPAKRPVLMSKFLKRWFKGQKECDWWGSHIPRKGTTVLDTGFFGYWAFEAALVTYLWDIDDSTYRDLPHYPKDLIDYARQNFPLGSSESTQRLRALAGEPCPREGWWVAVVKADSRRHLKAGELMPDLKSNAGATIWQWDTKQ
jgi:hypothetical protein